MDKQQTPDSSELDDTPLIGTAELQLFAIEDTRERADRLKDQLVPKLWNLLDEANELVCEIYGEDVLSPFRFPTTPAHRPGAKKTKSFEMATVGLAVDGQAWFFQQRFECTAGSLYVKLFGLRGLEGNPIVQVLKNHSEAAVELLKLDDYELGSSAIEPETGTEDEDSGFAEFISRLKLSPDREWDGTSITGSSISLPVADVDAAWPVIFDFIVLFPIFRSATHILQGEDDRFEHYSECFWRWFETPTDQDGSEAVLNVDDEIVNPDGPLASEMLQLEEDEAAWEGGFKVVFRRHRLREKRLRARKIQDVLRRENGHLRCEIVGCAFDFFEVYGEIGRDFAHVHHKNPLSDRNGPEKTALADLAIVCANCHAMIHRGSKCLPLDALNPRRP